MQRVYTKWFSPALRKEMELLVFGSGGIPVLFFPTRTARFYDYENWKIVEALRSRIEANELQLFCVDSNDIESFYSNLPPEQKIKRHQQYETYIVNEVVPFIRSWNDDAQLVSAGCSLGGYHAVNIAFKFPNLFTKVVGMSARYDLTISSPRFPDLFEAYFDEDIYYSMPSMYVPNMGDEQLLQQLRQLHITLVIGKEDPFLDNNVHLVQSLREKQVPAAFFVWNEEAHRPRYWRHMVQLYL